MPKVSVLMSIYRPNEQYLREQLCSIDEQEYDDMELVILNDCPDDQSWESFCQSVCVRHPVRYIQGEYNRGYVKAFEYLTSLTNSEYLAFADQDDIWLPQRVSTAVTLLDEGYLLVSCDRQVIDASGVVINESWRRSHPHDASVTWKSGDGITPQAAFTCYGLGMTLMMRTDIAKELMPFPTCTGHDKWLVLGASALGPCANIEHPLVQYRQHGDNQTGVLQGINSKADWYHKRVDDTCELVQEFARRFPSYTHLGEMKAFTEARSKKILVNIWRYRNLAPSVAYFEMALSLTPEFLFRAALTFIRREGAC